MKKITSEVLMYHLHSNLFFGPIEIGIYWKTVAPMLDKSLSLKFQNIWKTESFIPK